MSGSRKLVTLISFIRIIDTHINRLHGDTVKEDIMTIFVCYTEELAKREGKRRE